MCVCVCPSSIDASLSELLAAVSFWQDAADQLLKRAQGSARELREGNKRLVVLLHPQCPDILVLLVLTEKAAPGSAAASELRSPAASFSSFPLSPAGSSGSVVAVAPAAAATANPPATTAPAGPTTCQAFAVRREAPEAAPAVDALLVKELDFVSTVVTSLTHQMWSRMLRAGA